MNGHNRRYDLNDTMPSNLSTSMGLLCTSEERSGNVSLMQMKTGISVEVRMMRILLLMDIPRAMGMEKLME
jgi:hypothetical protein